MSWSETPPRRRTPAISPPPPKSEMEVMKAQLAAMQQDEVKLKEKIAAKQKAAEEKAHLKKAIEEQKAKNEALRIHAMTPEPMDLQEPDENLQEENPIVIVGSPTGTALAKSIQEKAKLSSPQLTENS